MVVSGLFCSTIDQSFQIGLLQWFRLSYIPAYWTLAGILDSFVVY